MNRSQGRWLAVALFVPLAVGIATSLPGCSSGSNEPTCGDGHFNEGEACDDGNNVDGDGCQANCTLPPPCGNGTLDPGEACDDGNRVADDGCEPTCVMTPGTGPKITICPGADQPPLTSATCEVTPGSGARLVTGTILTPGEVLRGGQVLIDEAGVFQCVACDCSASAAGATTINCPTGVVSPGLINSHDHITFTQNAPYTDTGERYEQRHDWRKGLRGHTKLSTSGNASDDEIRWGELRFLVGGATSTVGSGGVAGLLRNLDTADQEGLGHDQVDYQTFPLGDSSGGQLASGCDYPKVPTAESIAGDSAYFPHVAEGIDATARNEFMCLSAEGGGGHDVVVPQSAFIHAVGLTAGDYAQMAADGTALVWSPRSNVTLYGDTARVTEAARLGVTIALGTDWTATGSINMLRELACADGLNRTYYGGFFSDEELWLMATRGAAAATATEGALGVLATGLVGDLTIFDGRNRTDHRAVLAAEPKDVTLVLRGGQALYGDAEVVAGTSSAACDPLDVCGAAKAICLSGEVGKSLAQLTAAVGSIYPAFFCGTPDGEPSCVPKRPASVDGSTVYTGESSEEDPDGDGVPSSLDDCPDVFDPVRPVDGGKQADADADGDGDACDVCPLDADTTACTTTIDPGDGDRDGVPSATDNCPTIANADQADGDRDDKGDACDACPDQANPGTTACPASIYDVKSGVVPVGATVAVASVLVTGRMATGFFVQVKETDDGYAGADHSGVFVYDPTNMVTPGDRVSIPTARVADFYGQIQLTAATTVIEATGETAPEPVMASPAELATGGGRAEALEAVVVRVSDVAVSEANPAPGTGDSTPTNEFVVEGALRVDDALFLIAPPPTVGTSYKVLTGVLAFRHDNSKLEPRSADDVVPGSIGLAAFAPARTFVREGRLGAPSFPAQLTVTLSRAAEADTFVAVDSSAPDRLVATGGGVTIPAGQAVTVALLDALAPSVDDVTLTAHLDATILTVTVRVVGAAEPATLAALSPATAAVPPGGTVHLTASLDVPAPPGGAVVQLSVLPADAGALPATVTVAADQLDAAFDYVDLGIAPTATVTATLGASLMATVTASSAADHLVLNEIDYDQVGSDTAEFVEIYNGTGAAVSLADLAVVFINGSGNAEYQRVSLATAGTLAAGQFLVVGAPAVTVADGALKIDLTGGIQNGAPDAVGLLQVSTGRLIDALSYEGSVTAGAVTGAGTLDFTEGTPLPMTPESTDATSTGSLGRLPDGADANDAAADWHFAATPTPGAPNIP